MSDDAVFRALADSSRRELLDRLRERDGRTSQDLCRGLAMSRQAVAKHLSILEEAGLVSAQWKGREKLHFVNTAPIADVTEGWMARFHRPLPPLRGLNRRLQDEEERQTPPKAAVPAKGPLRSLRALARPLEEGEAHPQGGPQMLHSSRTSTAPRVDLRNLANLRRDDET